MSVIEHCEGCDRTMSEVDVDLARSRRNDGVFCGTCRDGATIHELRQQLRGAVDALREIAECDLIVTDEGERWFDAWMPIRTARTALNRFGGQ